MSAAEEPKMNWNSLNGRNESLKPVRRETTAIVASVPMVTAYTADETRASRWIAVAGRQKGCCRNQSHAFSNPLHCDDPLVVGCELTEACDHCPGGEQMRETARGVQPRRNIQ